MILKDKTSINHELTHQKLLASKINKSPQKQRPNPIIKNYEYERNFIGYCIKDKHPAGLKRYLIQWKINDIIEELWIPALKGLSIRVSDNLIFTKPNNSEEFIITGVLDNVSPRQEIQHQTKNLLTLKKDEAIVIHGLENEPLFEIYETENGPAIKILNENLTIDLPGKFTINAKELDLIAKQGEVNIHASGDVKINGEQIELN